MPLPRQSSLSIHRSRGAFTLVELLVVICIVAVLSSLILTGTKKALISADTSRCASQLRQLGQAILLYAGEHDQRLPGPLWSGQDCFYQAGGDPGQLVVYLVPYLNLRPADSTVRYTELLVCPSFRRISKIKDPRTYSMNGTVQKSDGTNGSPFGYPQYANNQFSAVYDPLTLMAIKAPDQSVAMYDIDRLNYSSLPDRVPPTPSHVKYRNKLFLDAHVEAVPIN